MGLIGTVGVVAVPTLAARAVVLDQAGVPDRSPAGPGLAIADLGDRYYLSTSTIEHHLHAAFRALGLGTLRHQARLGCACYLLGRYDGSREAMSR